MDSGADAEPKQEKKKAANKSAVTEECKDGDKYCQSNIGWEENNPTVLEGLKNVAEPTNKQTIILGAAIGGGVLALCIIVGTAIGIYCCCKKYKEKPVKLDKKKSSYLVNGPGRKVGQSGEL